MRFTLLQPLPEDSVTWTIALEGSGMYSLEVWALYILGPPVLVTRPPAPTGLVEEGNWHWNKSHHHRDLLESIFDCTALGLRERAVDDADVRN